MRILVVSQYFWPENFRINDLVAGLTERGHEVTVLTGIPNYPDGRVFAGYGYLRKLRQEYHGAKVMRVPLIPRGRGGGARLALNYLSFAFCASALAPFLCRGKFDVIFVFEPSPITVGLPAMVLKRLKSIPILFWVQDLWPESLSATGSVRSEWLLRIVRHLVRFIYRGCDRILVTSRAYFGPIQKLGVEPNCLRFFPQSVETLYQPVGLEPDTPERAFLPAGFRVMFAGNVGAAQSFETILEAAEKTSEYNDIQWIIIGDGRRRGWVEAEVERRNLGATVHLVGKHPVDAMPSFFSLADVLLVTLKKEPIFALTIPGKVQSYLACAKPIVAALDGEGSELVREAGAGLTCPAEDADALAEAVLTMYRMPEERREAMGQSGIRYHEANFARDMLIDRLEGWMREVSCKGYAGDANG